MDIFTFLPLGLNTPDKRGPMEFFSWLCQVVFRPSHKTALSCFCRSHGINV